MCSRQRGSGSVRPEPKEHAIPPCSSGTGGCGAAELGMGTQTTWAQTCPGVQSLVLESVEGHRTRCRGPHAPQEWSQCLLSALKLSEAALLRTSGNSAKCSVGASGLGRVFLPSREDQTLDSGFDSRVLYRTCSHLLPGRGGHQVDLLIPREEVRSRAWYRQHRRSPGSSCCTWPGARGLPSTPPTSGKLSSSVVGPQEPRSGFQHTQSNNPYLCLFFSLQWFLSALVMDGYMLMDFSICSP